MLLKTLKSLAVHPLTRGMNLDSPETTIQRLRIIQDKPLKMAALRGIVMFDVFHHLPDVKSFLTEAADCVKPGGSLFEVSCRDFPSDSGVPLKIASRPGWISGPCLPK